MLPETVDEMIETLPSVKFTHGGPLLNMNDVMSIVLDVPMSPIAVKRRLSRLPEPVNAAVV